MQTAGACDEFVSRAQVEMVSVGENNFGTAIYDVSKIH